MIEARNIVKKYGDLTVLKDVNIVISDSEIVSITGPSGAGKSTLLQILGTLERASSGMVTYDQVEVNKYSEKKLATFRNNSIGFIFQFHHLLPEFNALENVCMPAFIGGVSKQEALDLGEQLLSHLGLRDRMTHKPNELSGGEQQRVAIARALINRPKIVFADEPSGNLDSENAKELHQLFLDLRDQTGQTFLIVTHNQELAAIADKTLRMKDGRMLD